MFHFFEESQKKKLNKVNEPGSMINDENEKLLQEVMSVLRTSTDDCDVFGQFVAVELRQIRSEERKKRLKRIIQRAIMDIGEEEDSCENLSLGSNYNVSECASSVGHSTHNQNQDYLLTTLSNSPSTLVSHSSDLTEYLKTFNVENYSPSDNPVSIHQTTPGKPLEQFGK